VLHERPTTRLAPSPTGSLHLGNARTFAINHALAVQGGWRVVLRIEDLDGPRVKPEAVAGIQQTLQWLGITWEGQALVQSAELGPCVEAMRHLVRDRRAFPCELSRSQIEAAVSAPQEGDAASGFGKEVTFPPHLRPREWQAQFDPADERTNWRFINDAGAVAFVDQVAGPQQIDPSATIGDFIIWTKRRVPAYQLAVVVDDHRQNVTHIVRGDDLLDSAARQLLLYRALGFGPEPHYTHLPLVVGQDGRRLAKRHGDSRIDMYREIGVPPGAILGLIAFWSGVMAPGAPRRMISMAEFVAAFRLSILPSSKVVFTQEDDAWLRSCAQ